MANNQNIQYTITLKDMVTPGLQKAEGAAKSLEGTLGGIKTSAALAGAAIIGMVNALVNVGKEIFNLTSRFEGLNNVINYTSLNAVDAKKNHEFLQHLFEDYKLPISETTESFADFNAAMLGSALQGQAARDVFEGVSIAATAMHLDATKVKLTFMALNQMMSKGTVQAQELKLQLGNALPGAFRLAASSIGVTQAQLTKLMEEGKIISEDFLPKFAAKLKEEFGGAIPVATQSLTAKFTDLKNNIIETGLSIGEYLTPAFGRALDEMKDRVKQFRQGLENIDTIGLESQFQKWFLPIKLALEDVWKAIQDPMKELGAAFLEWKEPFLEFVDYARELIVQALKMAEEVLPAIVKVVTAIVRVAKVVYDLLDKLKFFEFLGSWFRGIYALIQAIGEAISWVYNTVIDPALTFMEKVLGKLFDLLGLAKELNGELNSMSNGKLLNPALTAVPQIPFTRGGGFRPQDVGETGGKTSSSANLSAKTGSSKVAGQKVLNITINIGSLVKEFVVKATTIQEAAPRVKELVTGALLSAVNDSQLVPDR